MPPISLLIKPASSNCNLRCKYCFYHSLSENREIKSYGIMDINTLEILVQKTLEYADVGCTFAFQGGEPTLVGLEFFEKLMEFQKKYNTKGVKINNALQTNGIVIDDRWAKFLHDNNFLVGLSLDGTKDVHDMNRIDSANKGTFNRIMKTVDLFNKHKVEYNILFVVNSTVARHVAKIYNFFKRKNFRYLQFIPCLDPLDEDPGGHIYSLTPDRFTTFLKTLFDLWYEDIKKDNIISIRYFDNLVGMLMGYPPENCGMSGVCRCQFVVEADGGVYPCDFYVIDKWYLGNLKINDFDEIAKSETVKEFIEVSRYVDPKCRQCKWLNLCRGGCRRNREPFADDRPVLNYFCSSYMEFFEYAAPRLYELARIFSMKMGYGIEMG